jgi:twitching motility protein PilT
LNSQRQDPSEVSERMEIQTLFREAVSHHASDLHLCAHVPPILRIDGVLRALNTPPLSNQELNGMILGILNDTQRAKFEADWELDFSFELPAIGRFRANVHRQRGNTEAAFRVIYEEIRSIRQLGLPPIVEEFCRYPNGLILITGPTGSGKTTTAGGHARSHQRDPLVHDCDDRRPHRVPPSQ